MPDKRVLIGGVKVGYAKKADVSLDKTSADSTLTFDGPVLDGSDQVSYTVKIEKLKYGTISSYFEMEKLLHSMLTEKQSITIIEDVRVPEGKLTTKEIVYNCILDGNDYSIDAENRTVETLSFKGGITHKWVNGKQAY